MFNQIQGRIQNLRLAHKLILMAVLTGVPTVITGVLFLSVQKSQIQLTEEEAAGLRYLRPFSVALSELATHRDLAAQTLATGEGTAELKKNEVDVDVAIQAVAAADAEFGDRFTTHGLVAEITEGWKGLKASQDQDPARNFDSHTLLLAQILDAIRLAGENSRLALDTDAASSYLGANIALHVPSAIDSLGQLSAFTTIAASNAKLSQAEWNQLAVLVAEAGKSSEAIRSSFLAAEKKKLDIDPALSTAANISVTSAEAVVEDLREGIANRTGLRADPAAARGALKSMMVLQSRLLDSARDRLGSRLTRLNIGRSLELALVLGAMLLAASLAWLILQTIQTQTGAMMDLVGRIRKGDLTARAKVTSGDELGTVAESLNLMLDDAVSLMHSRQERDRIQANIQKLLEEMAGVAKGDLTKEAEVVSEFTGSIAEAFNGMLVELRTLIRRVQQAAGKVGAAATGAESVTLELAEGNQSQAAQLVAASGAVEQMAASIQTMTEKAAAAERIAQEALRTAQRGMQTTRETIAGMENVRSQVQQTANFLKELGDGASRISEIAELIGELSNRTSFLALTASLQAAQAGDAGKGFAMVAKEVKHLAERSASSSKHVSDLIRAIQDSTLNVIGAINETNQQVTAGTSLATAAGERLGEIESVSQQLAAVINSISASCQEQSKGSETIAKSMHEISKNTLQTAAGAQEAATSIQELAGLVQELGGSVSRFRLPRTA